MPSSRKSATSSAASTPPSATASAATPKFLPSDQMKFAGCADCGGLRLIEPMDVALDFLSRLEKEFGAAITRYELTANGLLDHYKLLAAKHVHAAVRGYVILRGLGEISAAHHLMRPILEIVIRIKAIRRVPTTFYRIAMGEMKDDEGWLRGLANFPGVVRQDEAAVIKDRMDAFHARYVIEFPGQSLAGVSSSGLNMDALAHAAGLSPVYQAQYRLFCRHTHGNLSALAGQYRSLDLREDSFIAGCVLDLLYALAEAGVEITDLAKYHEEHTELSGVAG